MIKKLLLFLFLTLPLIAQESSFKLLDGNNNSILYTTDINKGLYVADLTNNKTLALESDFGSSYQAVLSFDGRFILYKNIDISEGNSSQTPMIYDLNLKKNIPLSEPQFQCGIPSSSKNGRIAFMAGHEIRILNPDLSAYKKIDIGNYANITAISPDGELIATNDNNNKLYLLNISTGNKEYFANGNVYYYEPSWSRDGFYISYKNIRSDIFVYSLITKKSVLVSHGSSLKWDGNDLCFVESKVDSNANVISTSLLKFNADRNDLSVIESNQNKFYNSIVSINNSAIYTVRNSNHIFQPVLSKSSNVFSNINLTDNADQTDEYNTFKTYKTSSPSTEKVIARFDSVYFNQVYDCRIDRAGIGDGCCGAASAMMGLMFYSLLPEWGYQSLNKAYSPYANYLSEIYTYKGVTYNISYTRSAGGYYSTGLGVYGWIYRNYLEDTKGHMAELFINHGLQSGVDWSPSVQKAINEIDGGYPFVVLNSLTDAGHFIVLTGYADRVGTFIYNDPYGDRNRSSYLRDKAIRIKYDYPGYSNGYANLNTAWCFIYMRRAPDITYSKCNFSYDYQPGSKINVNYQLKNTGLTDITSSFKVKLFLSEDKVIDAKDIVLYEKEYSSLSLTDSLADSTSFLPPISSSTKTYTLFLVSDADGKIVENTKANNTSFYEFCILGKPTTLILYPFNNSTIIHRRPTIFVSYDATQKIDTSTVKVYLNNKDITSSFQKFTNKIQFYPTYDYENGNYEVSIYLKNVAGYDTTITWSFKVDAPVVSVENPEQITKYELSQNYPNPFNPSTKITYSLAKQGSVKIILYDASGKEIRTLVDDFKNPGRYTFNLDAANLSSGTYLYQIITNDFTQTKKMVLVK